MRAVGEALQHGRPPAGGVEQVVADLEVVGDEVGLGRAETGEVHLVGPGDAELVAVDLHQAFVVPGHRLDSTDGRLARAPSAQAGWSPAGSECVLWREHDAALGELALEPGPLVLGVGEPVRRGRDLEGLAEPDERAVVGKLPGQGFGDRGCPVRRAKPGPGVHEVGHQQVVGPAPFLTFAKGPRQEVYVHDHPTILYLA